MRISRVNCDEMDRDRARQPANRNSKTVARLMSFAQITCSYRYYFLNNRPKNVTKIFKVNVHERKVLTRVSEMNRDKTPCVYHH